MSEFIIFGVLVTIAWIASLIFGESETSKLADSHGGEVVPLDDLSAISFPLQGACEACLIRQSGNLYRDLGVFPSVDDAIHEAAKSFRRAKVDLVRVTNSDAHSLAIYRQMYDFRGRAEGKKLAGVVISAVEAKELSNISLLNMTLRDLKETEPEQAEVFFDCKCGRCGSTDVNVVDETDDNSEVKCVGCGLVFGQYSEIKEIMTQRGLSAMRARTVSNQS